MVILSNLKSRVDLTVTILQHIIHDAMTSVVYNNITMYNMHSNEINPRCVYFHVTFLLKNNYYTCVAHNSSFVCEEKD